MTEIEIEALGKLRPHPRVPDHWHWLISNPIAVPFFDKKALKFVLEGDLSSDANFLTDANTAISNFLEKDQNDRDAVSAAVFKNYADFIEAVGEEELPEIKNEVDVWKFVNPSEIRVIRRHRRDQDIYLQIACECAWEIEHGLQIVFRQGKKLTRVSDQDGHLTEADAYDKPDENDELLSTF